MKRVVTVFSWSLLQNKYVSSIRKSSSKRLQALFARSAVLTELRLSPTALTKQIMGTEARTVREADDTSVCCSDSSSHGSQVNTVKRKSNIHTRPAFKYVHFLREYLVMAVLDQPRCALLKLSLIHI